MANWVREEGTEEGTGLVEGDDVGADQVLGTGAHSVEMELALERVQGQGGTDEGTVVADHARSAGGHGRQEVDPPVVDGLWRRPVLDQLENRHGCESMDRE